MFEHDLHAARGCMLGAAIGDALGGPTEFLKWDGIVSRFGPEGLTDFAADPWGLGAYTDDTQMAIAVARGILGSPDFASPMVEAQIRLEFVRWYRTQINEPLERRAPGSTCMRGCAILGGYGVRPILDNAGDPTSWVPSMQHHLPSKGNGSVMRAHPVAIAYGSDRRLGAHAAHLQAALTHDHGTAATAAEVWFGAVADALAGERQLLPNASRCADLRVTPADADEIHRAQLAIDSDDDTRTALNTIWPAGAWTAEQAVGMAIAAYERAVRLAETFADERAAVVETLLAVANIDGDSDTVCSMTGALLGAKYPTAVLGCRWAGLVQGRNEIEGLAYGLARVNDLISQSRG